MRASDKQFHEDIEYMSKFAANTVREKRKTPSNGKNILNVMLNKTDSKTGKKMTDQSIADNMITLLMAGHETTSALLSFACYRLCTNLDSQRKAQAEVDEVIGKGPIKVEYIAKLHYIVAILRSVPCNTVKIHDLLTGSVEKLSASIHLLVCK